MTHNLINIIPLSQISIVISYVLAICKKFRLDKFSIALKPKPDNVNEGQNIKIDSYQKKENLNKMIILSESDQIIHKKIPYGYNTYCKQF